MPYSIMKKLKATTRPISSKRYGIKILEHLNAATHGFFLE